MKKILAILLAGMMTATVFAGCGGGGNTESSGSGSDTQSSSDDGGAEVKDANLVDVSVFGDEDNISLKVWAPDKAVSLVKEQIEAFKAQFLTIDFAKLLTHAASRKTLYTESTFWFDIHYLVFGLLLVGVVLLILNAVWKSKLMKEEQALIAQGKEAV